MVRCLGAALTAAWQSAATLFGTRESSGLGPMEASPFTAGSIFALFILPGLIMGAAIVLAVVLKEKGE